MSNNTTCVAGRHSCVNHPYCNWYVTQPCTSCIAQEQENKDVRDEEQECPTQFEATTNTGDSFYFRLRHGSWRIEINGTTIAHGNSDQDGCCDWDDVCTYARGQGIALIKESDND